MALQRLSKQGHITLAGKRPGKWLIVPPEQAHYGAPPVQWWLDAYMQDVEPNYYLCLLSAARSWGSSHYATQRTQVMLSKARAPLKVGRLQVDFFVKRSIAATPTVRVRNAVAAVRVSTREATLLDLIRHQSDIGGPEAIARIAKDFSSELTSEGLQQALEALGQVPAAQRLGFLLDRLNLKREAQVVKSWLDHKRRNPQALELAATHPGYALTLDDQWGVWYTVKQRSLLEELG